jgi:hypothetical protein
MYALNKSYNMSLQFSISFGHIVMPEQVKKTKKWGALQLHNRESQET